MNEIIKSTYCCLLNKEINLLLVKSHRFISYVGKNKMEVDVDDWISRRYLHHVIFLRKYGIFKKCTKRMLAHH